MGSAWEGPWNLRWPAISALPAKAPYSRFRKLSRARQGHRARIDRKPDQATGAVNHVVAGSEVLSKAQEIANGIARMRTRSIKCIMGAMHVPYRIGLAEGKATEHENYMEMYDPKTFVAAVTALFEQRTIEFTD